MLGPKIINLLHTMSLTGYRKNVPQRLRLLSLTNRFNFTQSQHRCKNTNPTLKLSPVKCCVSKVATPKSPLS